MNILLLFWDGGRESFQNATVTVDMGLLVISENGCWYEYDLDDIKEFIYVNLYTLSYARDNGYKY